MLKKFLNKLSIRRLIEFFIGVFFLCIPIIFNSFSSYEEFKFSYNLDEEIFILPDSTRKPIIDFLDSANKSVDVTVYMLSDRIIIEKLKKIHQNGIDVNVILEKSPFGNSTANYSTFNELNKFNIDVQYSNSKFALTHAKYIIVDNEKALIMTSNLTYSGVTEDRDFLLFTNNNEYVKELVSIFNCDFNDCDYKPKIQNLVISPDNSRDKIASIITSAKSDINIYAENIADENIENLLIEKARLGVVVRMVLPSNSILKDNIKVIAKFKNAGINVVNMKKPYQHAKVIIVDNSIMYIGSINLSTQSMDVNREVGVITLNRNIISKVSYIFNNDFNGTDT